MDEKRTFPRTRINIPAELTIGNKKIQSHIVNLSIGGAYFEIPETEKQNITKTIIGKPAEFLVHSRLTKVPIAYNGNVIRVFEDTDATKYVALRFL